MLIIGSSCCAAADHVTKRLVPWHQVSGGRCGLCCGGGFAYLLCCWHCWERRMKGQHVHLAACMCWEHACIHASRPQTVDGAPRRFRGKSGIAGLGPAWWLMLDFPLQVWWAADRQFFPAVITSWDSKLVRCADPEAGPQGTEHLYSGLCWCRTTAATACQFNRLTYLSRAAGMRCHPTIRHPHAPNLQAKHAVCYSDGDKEELCMLTQFWKLKVAAPSALITSGLARAGETLYMKQLRPSKGRPAKGPSDMKLTGCRRLLPEGEARPRLPRCLASTTVDRGRL